tara:strand:- start:1637 stop:2485 length:849 start_codon:yes stop_codon:yes gene_type:complete
MKKLRKLKINSNNNIGLDQFVDSLDNQASHSTITYDDDTVIFDSNGFCSVIDLRLEGRFSAAMFTSDGCIAQSNSKCTKVILFCLNPRIKTTFTIRYTGSLYISRCTVYNLTGTSSNIPGIQKHDTEINAPTTEFIWDSSDITWDSLTSNWGDFKSKFINKPNSNSISVTTMPYSYAKDLIKNKYIKAKNNTKQRITRQNSLPNHYIKSSEDALSQDKLLCSNCKYFNSNDNYCKLWRSSVGEEYYCRNWAKAKNANVEIPKTEDIQNFLHTKKQTIKDGSY